MEYVRDALALGLSNSRIERMKWQTRTDVMLCRPCACVQKMNQPVVGLQGETYESQNESRILPAFVTTTRTWNLI